METLNITSATKLLYESNLPVFTIKTLRDMFVTRLPDTLYVYLRKLIRMGILVKLERGIYVLVHRTPDAFLIANVLHGPSYISCESALNMHGILSQFPYEVTSVTTNKPIQKTVQERLYSYGHIQPSLYWGYEKVRGALIAHPEKAILDQAYFAARGLRQFPLDEYEVSRIDKNRLASYMKRMPHTPPVQVILDKIQKEVLL
ncbi:MAG: hypothetical protein Q8L37_03125 [Candidatus Gottesmanbacteria bacterium]|nr:hypothetical protein [Candidatus Gottesmanbacteria bacterium]